MKLDELKTAITAVKKHNQLDYLSQVLWKQHGIGLITDDDAQSLAEAINSHRRLIQAAPTRRWSAPVLNRPKRSYSTRESIHRRRRQAAAGLLPPTVAAHFTLGEQSALSVIATMSLRGGGVCAECIAKIAAIAGVSRTVVQSALRNARQLGLLRVTERPRKGLPNLTNLVEITDGLWKSWLSKRLNGAKRVKFLEHHEIPVSYPLSVASNFGPRRERIGSGLAIGLNLSKTDT